MAFRFPLAAVLRVREIVEKREERALQKVQLEMSRILRQIEELNALMVNAHGEWETALQQTIPAGHLHTMMWEIQAAEEKKKILLHHLQVLEEQRDKQMKVYQVAHRDREMITDIFEQQSDAHKQEQARTQQKTLDDIFIARRPRS